MEFRKLDGTDARVWLETCSTYFEMCQITEGFRVAAATLYMVDNASHWYQSYKQTAGWHDWPKFREDVILEFAMNVNRDN